MKRTLISIRFFTLFLACILLYGCVPPEVQDPTISEVPDNAAEIRVYAEADPDTVLGQVRQELLNQAFQIKDYGNRRRFLTTDYKPIGGQLSLSIHVTVEVDVNNSKPVCVFRGYVSRPGETTKPVRWSNSGGDRARAFKEMRDVARKIPHELILYGVPL